MCVGEREREMEGRRGKVRKMERDWGLYLNLKSSFSWFFWGVFSRENEATVADDDLA